jgi:hypothetical protein
MFTSDTNEMQIWEAPPKKSTIIPLISCVGARIIMLLSSRILHARISSFLCAHFCSLPVLSLPPLLQPPSSSASVEAR